MALPSCFNGWSLQFNLPATEQSFVRSRSSRLASRFATLSAVCLVSCICGFGVWWANGFFSDVQILQNRILRTDALMSVVHRQMIALGLFALLCMMNIILVRCKCALQLLGPFGLEWLVLLELIAVASFVYVLDSYYFPLLCGYHPEIIWIYASGQKYCFSQVILVLLLDTIITASHLGLPVRWYLFLLVDAFVLSSGSLIIVWYGAPEDPGSKANYLLFLGLMTYSILGVRSLENQERNSFIITMKEKELRFNTEFRLSCALSSGSAETHDEGELAEDPEPLEEKWLRGEVAAMPEDRVVNASDAGSDRGALPLSNVSSGRLFARLHDSRNLEKIARLGEAEHWLIDSEELHLSTVKTLGEGSFSYVIPGSFQGTPVAVKVPKQNSHQSSLTDICNELRIFRRVRHPNIVQFHGACIDYKLGDFVLVIELLAGETLEVFVGNGDHDTNSSAYLCDSARCNLPIGLCRSLIYLHTRQPCVVHGDLKASNAFAEHRLDGPHLKLLDLGLARVVSSSAKPLGGTHRWAAPEVFGKTNEQPRPASDVFSFARLLFFIVSGHKPLDGLSKDVIKEIARAGHVPPLEWPVTTALTERSQAILDKATQISPQSRPPMCDIYDELMRWPECLALPEAAGYCPATFRKLSSKPAFLEGGHAFWQKVDQVRDSTGERTVDYLTSSPQALADVLALLGVPQDVMVSL